MASPSAFHSDPEFAWGFYGHRRALYRRTEPHAGFSVLADWLDGAPVAGLVATSNVDGHFHTAGNPDRKDLDEHQELYYPAICRAINATGYDLYLAHEFFPKGDKIKALKAAFDLCNV